MKSSRIPLIAAGAAALSLTAFVWGQKASVQEESGDGPVVRPLPSTLEAGVGPLLYDTETWQPMLPPGVDFPLDSEEAEKERRTRVRAALAIRGPKEFQASTPKSPAQQAAERAAAAVILRPETYTPVVTPPSQPSARP